MNKFNYRSYVLYVFGILIGIISQPIFAQDDSKIISPKELTLIETRIKTELSSKKLSNDKKFLLNTIAGRELYQFRFYQRAQKYYEDALSIKTNENKTEPHVNLIAIAINLNDKKLVETQYKKALDYFEQNKNYKTSEIDYYLKSIDAYLNNKEIKKVDGFYGAFAQEENLINLIKNKEYLKAFSAINPEAVKKSTNNFNIIVYDSLNTLINKNKVKELYCAKDYQLHPKAYTYSVILCGLLTDYKSTSQFSVEKMKRAENYFSNDNTEKMYLLEMVKEISK